MTTDKTMKNGTGQPPAFVLSADPNRAMQEMMETIDALRSIYMEENVALKEADASKFIALQDRKIGVARAYQSSAAQMLERKEELKTKADPRLRTQLERKKTEFLNVSGENLKYLDTMMKGTKRLGDRITQAARDAARKETHCYGAKGEFGALDRRVSIGVNESA